MSNAAVRRSAFPRDDDRFARVPMTQRGSTAALVGEFVYDLSVIRSGHRNWDGIGVRSARSGRSLFQGDRVKADVQIHLSRVNALATPVENHWRAAA